MAGFVDALNQGLGNLTGTPLGQLGMQLMAASGYQQGNPGAGARLGQALTGMGQMQMQQQQLAQQKQLREYQNAIMARQMKQIEREDEQRAKIQELVKSNPSLFAGSPMAQAMLGATGDVGMAAEMSKLGPQAPKIGAMPYESTITNPDGTQQMQRYNPQTGSYENVGGAFTPTAQQSVNLQGLKYQHDVSQDDRTQNRADKQFELSVKTADTAAASADARAMAEQRKMQAAQLKNAMSKNELEGGYNGAVAQLDDTIKLATDIMNSPGLAGNFGLRGAVPNVPGSDAANTRALIEQLQAQAGLTGLVRLEQQGVKLTPVSNTDLATAQNSVVNLTKAQDVGAAKAQLQQYIDAAKRAKDEAGRNYGQLRGLYELETPNPRAPQVGTVMDGYRYNGGDPASPSSWSKQ